MAITVPYRCISTTGNTGYVSGGPGGGLYGLLLGYEATASATAASDQGFMFLKRGDSIKLTFTKASTHKMVVTPLANVFTSNVAQTTSTHNGVITFTLSSSATLGNNGTDPILKVEAQTSSGTPLASASAELHNPAYFYIHVDPSVTATHNFNVGFTNGSLKQNATVTVQNDNGGSTGTNASNPLTLAAGDLINVSYSGSGSGVSPENLVNNGTQHPYSAPGLRSKSQESMFKVYPPTTNAVDDMEYLTSNMTTGGNIVKLTWKTTDILSTGVGSIFFKVNGDGLPNTFSDLTTSNTVVDTFYTKTVTVAGLASGKEALFFIRGGSEGEAVIKVGSGSYSDFVLASNGDTLTLKAKSSSSHNFGRWYKLVAMQGDGAVNETIWTVEDPVKATGAYGMEFYNAANKRLLSIDDKSARFVNAGAITFSSHTAGQEKTESQTIANLTDVPAWRIMTYLTPGQDDDVLGVQIRGVTKSNGSFDVKTFSSNSDNLSKTYTVSYIVLYSE